MQTISSHQAPSLIRRSPHSFTCFGIVSFTEWLQANSFHQIDRSRSLVEHSRWERSGRIVICYNSGSIVVQGVNPELCIALLETLVAEQHQLELAGVR